MKFERWGSLSVDDHLDTRALVANVLLYDRLVVPVMTEQPDRNERAYWISKGWDPDLQLRGCANRLTTIRAWQLLKRSNSLRPVLCDIRYSPIGASSKRIAATQPKTRRSREIALGRPTASAVRLSYRQ